MSFLKKFESDLKALTKWLTGGIEKSIKSPKKKVKKKKRKYSKRRSTSLSG